MLPNRETAKAAPRAAGSSSPVSKLAEDIKDWKGFAFSHGFFLLHIPSSSFFEVTEAYYKHVSGNTSEPSIKKRLVSFEEAYHSKQVSLKHDFKVKIRSIALNVAEKCNLRCGYCFAGDGDYGSDSMMEKDVAIQSIEKLSKYQSSFHISFFGGEPLLNFALIERVVEWTKTQKTTFTFAITTNGTLLNQRHMDLFKSNDFKVTISYDGPKVQDIQRKGVTSNYSSDKILRKKLDNFSTALSKLSTKLRATLTNETIDHYIEGIAAQLQDFSDCHTLAFRNAASSDNKLFSVEDANKLNEAFDHIVESLIQNQQFEFLAKLKNAIAYLPLIKVGKRHVAACGAGLSYISVSTTGSYYLCHRFTETESQKVGNFRAGLDLSYLGEIQDYRNNGAKKCQTCYVRNFCRGGCFHENVENSESIFEPNEVFCAMQEGNLKTNLKVYSKLNKDFPSILSKLTSLKHDKK